MVPRFFGGCIIPVGFCLTWSEFIMFVFGVSFCDREEEEEEEMNGWSRVNRLIEARLT